VEAVDVERWFRQHGQRELELILWAAWDPSGLRCPPNEYEGEASAFWAALRGGATEAEIARLLGEKSTGRNVAEIDARVAGKLCDWYQWRVEERLGLDSN
jgi:hypothetical protein